MRTWKAHMGKLNAHREARCPGTVRRVGMMGCIMGHKTRSRHKYIIVHHLVP